MEAEIEKVGKLIGQVKSFMMTTIDSQGKLCSRPMMAPKQQFNGDIYFFSSRHSGKVHEIEQDQEVNLSSSSFENELHLSLTGRAAVIDDRDKARELWSPLLAAWFPQGVDDPALILIRVTVDRAEYWETHDTAVGRAFKTTKAIITGQPYQVKPEDHGKINIRH